MRPSLRVIVDRPRDGASNMAVDDVLLAGVGVGFTTTVRFYRWARPTVSLGYAQPWRQGYDPAVARRQGVDLVRRRTGGRAVLHAHELTYSVSGPAEDGPLAGGIHATYAVIARGLAAGLGELGAGVELVSGREREREDEAAGACFGARARHEIVAQGRKLLGSAQRRAAGRILQHGSLPLARPRVAAWSVLGAGGAAAARTSVGLEELLPVAPRFEVVARFLAVGLADALGLEPRRRGLDGAERRAAARGAALYREHAFTYRV